ncbi:MAG: arsenic efflux protein [Clostridia bacterium]|nr:arsenic efflux protein [Clostridia bacterium]MDE7328184.1 arsenic efflux protein [Clostridia bacterium]
MWDVLLDAFLDTLKLSWLLLIFYILIELVEQKIAVKMRAKLKSKYAVAVGAGFGIVPQCGFSVLASDLYSKRQITLGALLAVFIATSDEALPILLSSINQDGVWLKLILLIATKFVLALIAGYAIDLIIVATAKKKQKAIESNGERENEKAHSQKIAERENADEPSDSKEQAATLVTDVYVNTGDHEYKHSHDHGHEHEHNHDRGESEIHDREHSRDEEQESEAVDIHKGCCGHHIDDSKESKVKRYLVHPLLHTLKILAYILIINIVMGILVYYVGEDRIADFMSKSGVLQPILVTLVGLIPNCASSVIITELYLADTISFGSCIGGLIVNAGLGIAFLFKANKNFKQNLAIVGGLFVFALVVAVLLHFLA